ncbi:hypothetical protein [Proteus phage 10]|nr:hypothetical protein [Proteus phage 10]
MRSAMLPFRIKITDSRTIPWALLRPVTSLDIYDGLTTELNDEGLYSIPIFGRVGSTERDDRFSYIHVKSSIFHPDIFRALSALKQIYAGIMAGTVYAKWDDVEKDFIKSSSIDGETGFSFFTKHWKDIVFKDTGSPARADKIKLVEMYKDSAMYRNVLVAPAGIRDIQIDEKGRTIEHEINSLYRKLLSAANTISDNTEAADSEMYDNARWNLQSRFNEIFTMYADMLEGKKGILQQKWGSRRIFNGTRNVITAAQVGTGVLGSMTSPHLNDTQIGLYQLMRGALPLTIHLLMNGWLSSVFAHGTVAKLIDRKTLKSVDTEVDIETVTKWTTAEGLEKLINGFSQQQIRNKPITVNGNYLGLVYADDKYFKVFGDIDELPEQFDKRDVHPMTYTELFYLAGYQRWNTLYMLVTRYPITGMGSVYQTKACVQTTIVSSVKQELDYDWQPIPDAYALVFPKHERDVDFSDTLSVHPSRLGLLGGDYDGDTMSATVLLSEDALEECRRTLAEKETYINSRGEFLIDVTNDTVDFVLKALTSGVNEL